MFGKNRKTTGTACAKAATAAAARTVVESLEVRRHLSAALQVNVDFQTEATADVPAGYIADIGRAYGKRSNGRFYGWSAPNESQARERNVHADQRYDTLTHFAGNAWEIAVPNGTYSVGVVAGDPAAFDSVYRINVENTLVVSGTPTSGNRFIEGTANVVVTDGRLTLSNGAGAVNNKIAFVEIKSVSPTVSISAPDSSAGESGLNHAKFRITRTGDLSQPLGVHFAVGGTATNGVDYGVAGNGVTIPAGSASIDLTLRAIPDSISEPTETMTITVTDVGAYVIEPTATMATVTIADGGASPAEVLKARVNFQPYDAPVPAAYIVDGGAVYGRRANGLIYGWNHDKTADTVDRDSSNAPDQRYDTLTRMAEGDEWAIAVPNGMYEVRVAAGDPTSTSGHYSIDVEGVRSVDHEPTSSRRFIEETRFVVVTDGAITITNGFGAENNKLLFVDIVKLTPGAPAAPKALTATAQSPTSVRLEWHDRSSNEMGFRIERRRGNGEWARIATVDAGTESFTDTGLSKNADYSYRVRAFNTDGNSGYTVADVRTVSTTVAWNQIASSPIKRAEANGVVVNNKLYLFGGLFTDTDQVVRATARSDVYDPATNTWTRIADQPEKMTHSPAVVVGDVIWFIGGYVGDHPGPGTTHVWKYDISANSWSRGPDLPSARGAGGAGLIGSKIYFFGGMEATRTQERGTLFILDLNNQGAGWTQGAQLPNPRNHIAGIAVGGYLYALGGQYGQEEVQDAQDDIHRYDPTTNTWTKVADFPTGRSHITAGIFELHGRIIIVGGETGDAQNVRSVTMFNPADNSLVEMTQLPQGRSTVVAGALNDGRIIFATGNGPAATEQAWIGTLV